MVFISAAFVFYGLVHENVPPKNIEMPIFYLFEKTTVLIEIIIFTAMALSAITGLTGTCVFFEKYIPEKKSGIVLGIAAIPITYVSFGKLTDILYPIFGFAGIFLMIMLALPSSKKYNKRNNNLRGRGRICRIQKIIPQK